MRSLRRPPECSSTARKSSRDVEASTNASSRCATTSCHLRAIASAPGRHLDDAEVLRLPVGAHDPAAAGVLDLVFVIALARQEQLELELRVARRRRTSTSVDTVLCVWMNRYFSSLVRYELRVEAVVLLLLDQRIRGDSAWLALSMRGCARGTEQRLRDPFRRRRTSGCRRPRRGCSRRWGARSG